MFLHLTSARGICFHGTCPAFGNMLVSSDPQIRLMQNILVSKHQVKRLSPTVGKKLIMNSASNAFLIACTGFVSALKQLLQDNNMDLVEKGVRAIQQLTQLDVGHRIFANFDAGEKPYFQCWVARLSWRLRGRSHRERGCRQSVCLNILALNSKNMQIGSLGRPVHKANHHSVPASMKFRHSLKDRLMQLWNISTWCKGWSFILL